MSPRGATRRRFLRGALGGVGVSLALPWLESLGGFTGVARAKDSGFPLRFGLFFWGNGNRPDQWTPVGDGAGAAWALSEELAPLAPHKSKVCVVSGLSVKIPNIVPHSSGAGGILSAAPVSADTFLAPSIDQVIAQAIGGETLFRSIQTSATNSAGLSYNGPNSMNPPEWSPYALFDRLFGPTFRAPGEEGLVDPTLGLRRSVLDAVMSDLTSLQTRISTADKARLDQHLTGVRELEQRLAKLEEDPPSLASCARPAEPLADYPDEGGRPQISARSRAMCDLLAMSLACDQTRVFSHYVADPVSDWLWPGADKGHHSLTHDEAGEQPQVNQITTECVEELAYCIGALDAIPEGDETLLDHLVLFGGTEISEGRTHSLDEMPVVLAGSACGQLQTDYHYRSTTRENATRLLITLQRVMGMTVAEFGTAEGYETEGLSAIEV